MGAGWSKRGFYRKCLCRIPQPKSISTEFRESTRRFEMEMKSDFFLSAAGESEGLASPRACWEKARLKDQVRDDHMLVEIEPPLIGQGYGLGGQDITSLILSARHEGFPLFPVKEWPCHVYIARILDDTVSKTLNFYARPSRSHRVGNDFPHPRRSDRPRQKIPVMSFLNPSRRKSEEVRVLEIRFLGEQDGSPEGSAYRLLSPRPKCISELSTAQINGTRVLHDANGNMTSGPLNSNIAIAHTYDVRNRLTAVASSGATPALSYTYDSEGTRTSVIQGSQTNRFSTDPTGLSCVLMMTRQNGSHVYYVYGPGLLYQVDDNENTTTYHYDLRGSTVALSNPMGYVTDRVEYSAYGAITKRLGLNDTPFLYNGRYGVMTDANGLYYMRARYYNPMLRRFHNADPSGFQGGMNWYAYADGNPISMMDPFGLCAEGWGGETAGLDSDEHCADPLNSAGTSSTAVNFAAYMTASVVGGLGDLLRLGHGTANATYNSQDGWDVAIGITQDIGRAAGITTLVGGGLESLTSDLSKVSPYCFAAGTKVSTPNGDVNIEDVKAGDEVWAFDFTTGKAVERKVTELMRNFTYYWVDVQVGGENIQATRRHPFWIENENRWVEAIDLKEGMSVRVLSGNTRTISGVHLRELQNSETTYNFEVETDHDYYVGQNSVLVHNPYPVSPQYPPATAVGENFQFNFDASPQMRNSRAAGVDRAISGGYVNPNDGPFHHINSVQTYPQLAAEPSNIQGTSSRANHLDTHSGNWRTPTTGPLTPRPGC